MLSRQAYDSPRNLFLIIEQLLYVLVSILIFDVLPLLNAFFVQDLGASLMLQIVFVLEVQASIAFKKYKAKEDFPLVPLSKAPEKYMLKHYVFTIASMVRIRLC